jgi:hypothetical protein
VRQFGYLLMRVLAGPFGFVPLGWPMLASLLGVVAGYLAATELVKTRKYWFGRKAGSSTSA